MGDDTALESLFEAALKHHNIGDLAVRYVGSRYLVYRYVDLNRGGPGRATPLSQSLVATATPENTLQDFLNRHHTGARLYGMENIPNRPGEHHWMVISTA